LLAQVHRLRSGEDFSLVVRRGRKAVGPTVVIHLLDDPQVHSVPRVGFVVSKAIGSAAERNRVKRRLRHLMRGRMAALSPGARLVVRALPESAHQPSRTLAVDLDRALAQVGAA
jgi:ribonuclease P protein component